jgi:hypothetical protein
MNPRVCFPIRQWIQRFIPGPGPETRSDIRRRTTLMRMVNPTLSTIQNRHPLVAHPLPPPPNTTIKRFTIHRQGGIQASFLARVRYGKGASWGPRVLISSSAPRASSEVPTTGPIAWQARQRATCPPKTRWIMTRPLWAHASGGVVSDATTFVGSLCVSIVEDEPYKVGQLHPFIPHVNARES